MHLGHNHTRGWYVRTDRSLGWCQIRLKPSSVGKRLMDQYTQSGPCSNVNYPPIVSLCTSNGNIGTTSKFCSVFWCFLWQKISKIDIVLAHQPRRKKQCSFCFRFSSSWMIPPFPAFTDALNYVIIHVASSRGGLGDWNFNHSCLLQRHFLGLFARCLLFHICVVGGEDEPFQASLPFERHDQ